MPRVRYSELARRGPAAFELAAPRPTAAAPGYTPIMLVTEWLTLNLRGDWAMRVDARTVMLVFTDPEDRERARARLVETPA